MGDAARNGILCAVGQKVAEARAAAGLSQKQVAERIGITRASVANLEAGRQDMNLSRLAGLAQVLSLDLNELIGLVDLPPLPPQPHAVEIKPAFEVTCATCGDGVPLLVTYSRELAAETRDDHIAQHLEADEMAQANGAGNG